MERVVPFIIIQLFILVAISMPVLATEELTNSHLGPKTIKRYHQLIQQGVDSYNQDRWNLDSPLMHAPHFNRFKKTLRTKGIKQLPKITLEGDQLALQVGNYLLKGIQVDFLKKTISVGEYTYNMNNLNSVDRELELLEKFLQQHPPVVEKLTSNWLQEAVISSAYAEPVTAAAVTLTAGQVALALAGTVIFITLAAGLIIVPASVAQRLHGDLFADQILEDFDQNILQQLGHCQALPTGISEQQQGEAETKITTLFNSYNRIADYRIYNDPREAMASIFPWVNKLTTKEMSELRTEHNCTDFSKKFLATMNRYKWVDHKLTVQKLEQTCLHSQQLEACLKGLGDEIYNQQRSDRQKEYFELLRAPQENQPKTREQ